MVRGRVFRYLIPLSGYVPAQNPLVKSLLSLGFQFNQIHFITNLPKIEKKSEIIHLPPKADFLVTISYHFRFENAMRNTSLFLYYLHLLSFELFLPLSVFCSATDIRFSRILHFLTNNFLQYVGFQVLYFDYLIYFVYWL